MYLMWGVGNPNICTTTNTAEDDESQWTCDLSTTYKHTFAPFFHLESQSQSHYSVISYMNGFFIGLIMLNVLIATITNYFMVALEKGDQSFWRNRMQYVVECQSLFGLVSFFGLCPNDLHYEMEGINGVGVGVGGDNDYDKVQDNEEEYYQPMITTGESNHGGGQAQQHGRGCDIENENVPDDTMSIRTDASRTEKVLIQRIAFGSQNWETYKRKMGKEERRFFKWWYDKSNGTNRTTPSLKIRLKYFFRYAAIEEIMFPGKEYENILLGIQYNKNGRGFKLLLARLASYIQSLLNMIIISIVFLLGTVTFGLLWHRKMKEHLFCVKEMDMNDQHIEKADEMKQELLENLEDYELNQEKKLDKIFKKQEEKGKKQYTKIAKQQKEFTKKQKNEFQKIDRYLAEIKNLLNEIGTKEQGLIVDDHDERAK